ncbi:bactofilin family protein [Polaromonas sp.]|uniref:bactofilin family protein n=1 Tax=Polaromonas sp. TaxID=1869339 RepID=UPI003C84540C
MALQSPFFGKRDNEPTGLRHGSPNPNPYANTPAATNTPSVAPVAAQQPASPAATAPRESGGSKLTVGPNIKLKGVEITDCDTLVVEGLVEATMDSRVMQIAERGAFKGSAEIDIAEIHGEFDGNLTVRQKLVIFATGKVTGKIRYGKLVIEEGGQLAGEILFGAVANSKAAMLAKSGLQVA